jgi:hypothetical protein
MASHEKGERKRRSGFLRVFVTVGKKVYGGVSADQVILGRGEEWRIGLSNSEIAFSPT